MGLFEVYPRFNITLTKGRGVYVYDDKNQKYLDLYGGHGVISIGHAHPTYTKRLQEQLNSIGFYSNSVQIPIQNELTDRLAELSGYPTHHLFLCNSGAEANENALRLASFHTNKRKIIAFKKAFHGRTAASLNVTDNQLIAAPINHHNFPVVFIDMNDKQQLFDALKEQDVCAVIVEGIQGVGGLDAPSEDYLYYLEESCKKNNSLLILDEIQSGFGRTGKFFSHQYADIKADIITMAKGMGNGFPVGSLLIHPKIKAQYGMLGTTFGGNHLACAASIAVLDTLESENLLNNVLDISSFLTTTLATIPAIKKIKGKGLMIGVEMDFPIKEIRNQLLNDYHIFTGASSNPNLLRILPPLNITQKEIVPFINALKAILS